MGHEVCAVDDGAAALERLGRPDSPRIAILDWMMPGLDGLSVCRSLRQAVGPYTYVILLTARETRRDMVEALDAGADDFLTKPLDVLELRARLRSGERIIALQEDLLRTQSELEHQASHDRLTGLWNRGRVLDQLTRELYRTRREKACLAVVMADIDHFKRINDTWGHATGDVVLCDRAADAVRAACLGRHRPLRRRGVPDGAAPRRRQRRRPRWPSASGAPFRPSQSPKARTNIR